MKKRDGRSERNVGAQGDDSANGETVAHGAAHTVGLQLHCQ